MANQCHVVASVVYALLSILGALLFVLALISGILSSFLQHHVFFSLALIPGVIGICAHWLKIPRQLKALKEEHDRYRELKKHISKEWGDVPEPTADAEDYLNDFLPRWFSIIVGALIVTTTFSIAAVLSDNPMGIGVVSPSATATSTAAPTLTVTATATSKPTPTPASTPIPTSSAGADASRGAAAASGQDPASPTASITATPTSTASAAETAPQGQATSSASGDGRRGLVFAAYGSYVATLYILISRLDSSGLTGLFLVNSGLHAAIAMVLGFMAGDFAIFGSLTNNPNLLYFLLGMFPFWVVDFLKKKAVVAFQETPEPGCENLALCLVDGLDDGTIDRLSESGIWNIQNLAAAVPMEVSARTLYPLDRVLDWIDQAILISFVRSRIVACRDLGIRGASQLASTYGSSRGYVFALLNVVTQRDNADSLLDNLATVTKIARPAFDIEGRRLFHDRQVNLIIRWRRGGPGPINAALLIEAVLAAVREAAHAANIQFDPAPALGQPVYPRLAGQPGSPPSGGPSELEYYLPGALDRALGRLGYRWLGTFADFAKLSSWNEVVNEILNHTIDQFFLDQFGPQPGSPPFSPP